MLMATKMKAMAGQITLLRGSCLFGSPCCFFIPSRLSLELRASRSQSTSTMDLVDSKECTPLTSTLHFYEKRDFDPSLKSSPKICKDLGKSNWHTLLNASASRSLPFIVESCELDLIQAAKDRDYYDKIVLLVSCCELDIPRDSHEESTLSGRGVGQALSLSRRTANFCNRETGFLPELILVPPLRCIIETAMFSFPQSSPHSLSAAEWICHPHVQDIVAHPSKPGVSDPQPLVSAKIEILENTDSLLQWIQKRSERVIVGKLNCCLGPWYAATPVVSYLIGFFYRLTVASDSPWLQAFSCSLRYSRGAECFREGELRAVGLHFL
jgi:hypothetical protein